MGNETSTEVVGISGRRSYYNERRRKSNRYNQTNFSYRLDNPQRSLNVLPDVSQRLEQESEMPQDQLEIENYRKQTKQVTRHTPTVVSAEPGDNPDRILQRLNKKNEELRRELRDISEMLSEKLEKRKIVVKKKYETVEQTDAAATKAQKRELENAYKQIDMYKRQIQELRSKQEGEKGFLKVDNLENDISTKDREIEQLLNDIKAHKNIKKGQEKIINKDLNQEQTDMIDNYKREIDSLKLKLKQISKRDRVREQNYKRQHAYCCQLERLKGLKQKQQISRRAGASVSLSTSSSPNKKRNSSAAVADSSLDKSARILPSSKQFTILKQQLAEIKRKHDEYHKKIDGMILLKNKHNEERLSVENVLKEKLRAIDALKLKVEELKKLGKVRQKNLFGSGDNSTLNAESAMDGAEKDDPELSPEPSDAFNIDHLIANIPKPNRSVRKSSVGSETMPLNLDLRPAGSPESERNQVKVWNASKNRRQVSGEQARGELKFDDKAIFEEGEEPKIVGLNIWMTQQEDITAIQAVYTAKGQIRQGYKSSNPNGNMFHYDLKVPDYVKSITGGYAQNGSIEYIVFVSKSGKIGRFGKVNSETEKKITFEMQQNQRPYCLSGSSRLFGSDVRITRIGIDICKD